MIYPLHSDRDAAMWADVFRFSDTHPLLSMHSNAGDMSAKVLVLMEDDVTRVALFQAAFEEEGYQVLAASSIHDVLQFIRVKPVNCLVLNAGMMGAGTILALREIGIIDRDISVACYGYGKAQIARMLS